MDLTNMIPGGAGEEQAVEQRLSKEEYAAMKKQQREEVWAEVDAQAQAVFQNGEGMFHAFHGIPDNLIRRITAIVHTLSPPYRFHSASLRCFPDISCTSSCSFACLNRSSISKDCFSICWLKRIFLRSSFNSPLIS